MNEAYNRVIISYRPDGTDSVRFTVSSRVWNGNDFQDYDLDLPDRDVEEIRRIIDTAVIRSSDSILDAKSRLLRPR